MLETICDVLVASPWRAYEHIERLEHICKIVLVSGNYKKENYNV
jgi:hypothetical protein